MKNILNYSFFFGLAWGHAHWFLKDQVKNWKGLFSLIIFFFSFIGAKLLFGIVNDYHLQDWLNGEFWLGGGLVFYGGVLGGVMGVYAINFVQEKFFNQQKFHWSSFVAPLCIGHFWGRMGCFVSGCCFGKIWASTFWPEVFHRFPTQLIEGFYVLFLGLYLKKHPSVEKYLFFYAVMRFILEFWRDDERGHLVIAGWPFSTSQVVSLMILIGLFFNFLRGLRVFFVNVQRGF
jgi:phosphatidylglycerol:prolipoprotein diacylglycerol transferase